MPFCRVRGAPLFIWGRGLCVHRQVMHLHQVDSVRAKATWNVPLTEFRLRPRVKLWSQLLRECQAQVRSPITSPRDVKWRGVTTWPPASQTSMSVSELPADICVKIDIRTPSVQADASSFSSEEGMLRVSIAVIRCFLPRASGNIRPAIRGANYFASRRVIRTFPSSRGIETLTVDRDSRFARMTRSFAVFHKNIHACACVAVAQHLCLQKTPTPMRILTRRHRSPAISGDMR
jgi:hypothetical protein